MIGYNCMERKQVTAANIRSVGYDARARVLEIEFSSGSIIQYERVSPEVHRSLLAAPSISSFFRDHIEEDYTPRRVR